MRNFDVVIRNGTLVDPQRKQITVGHIGIRDSKIAAITREDIVGQQQLDAKLAVVCPGFIDIHAHVDNGLIAAQGMARQGITTTVGGNCGMGPVNLQEFFQPFANGGFPIHQLMFIGESFALRQKVGAIDPYKAATPQQIKEIVFLAEQALEQGAVGISLGLEYAPGTSFAEVTAVSQVAAKYGKLVSIHTRQDGWSGLGGLKEAIKITQVTGAAVQVSHLVYMLGMGMMDETVRILDEAVNSGLDITADSGLYHAFSTFIGSAVFDDGCIEKWDCQYNDLLVCTGKYAGERCTRMRYEELRREYPDELVIAYIGKQADVYKALEPNYVMVSSDGGLGVGIPGTGHPQNVGTFPRFFQTMVREQQKLSLLAAVTRCTLLPAERLGLKNKGRLQIGADADIVVFNCNDIADRADYMGAGQPDAPPVGIDYVIVAGQIVVNQGIIQDNAVPGKSIRIENRQWSW
jgi:N-acyl-D-amino-acid deacylase